MSDIFPKWTNHLPIKVAIGAALVAGAISAGAYYYLTPRYANVGYQPIQPVAFSHEIHAGQLGIDCRYCHSDVEKSWYSNVPSANTCMNCHNQVLKDDPKLALVRESAASGKPIPWVQVHKVPDYVYFNHAVHVNRGISCVKCHGQINHMDEVRQDKSLTMSFCLDCHRHPELNIRPTDKVTDLDWKWSNDPKENEQMQKTKGAELVKQMHVQSLESCSACHR